MGLKDTERTWIWHALTSVESLSTCCSGGPNPWKLTDHLPKLSPNSQHTHSTTQPGPRLKSRPGCNHDLPGHALSKVLARAAAPFTPWFVCQGSLSVHSRPLCRTPLSTALADKGAGRQRGGEEAPSWAFVPLLDQPGSGRREGGGSGLGPLRDVCSW